MTPTQPGLCQVSWSWADIQDEATTSRNSPYRHSAQVVLHLRHRLVLLAVDRAVESGLDVLHLGLELLFPSRFGFPCSYLLPCFLHFCVQLSTLASRQLRHFVVFLLATFSKNTQNAIPNVIPTVELCPQCKSELRLAYRFAESEAHEVFLHLDRLHDSCSQSYCVLQ